MFFFYIDESGNTGKNLNDATEPVHWLLALGTTEHGLQAIETDMLAVATKYFKTLAHDPEFEIHGVDLFARRGHARDLSTAERVGLYSEILAIVGNRGAKIWVRGIHKVRHRDRAALKGYAPEHPYKLGFMYLVESPDEWLAARQPSPSEIASGAGATLGLLVSDEQDEVSRDLVSGFARWRQFGTDHGYRTRAVRYLIDTIHYVKSQDSWLIQLVDCIAFLRNRYQKIGTKHNWDHTKYDQSEAAVVALWQQHCHPHVVDDRTWPQ
jgi:hypothetical protein